jgi:Tfp pilus assembly major pilin PilA
MKFRQTETRRAFTIIEAMIAAVVLVIAIIGTSSYRYHAALGIRQADFHSTGVRIALMLCEGWAGVDGNSAFSPVTTFSPALNISTSTGIAAPTNWTKLNSYKIMVDGFAYFATLSYKNMGSGITSLHVVVSWNQSGHWTNTLATAGKTYQLTTYVKTPS